jgi:superoxide dismutase, Fe-Mn family
MTRTDSIHLSRRGAVQLGAAGVGAAALAIGGGRFSARAQDSTPTGGTPDAGGSTSAALQQTYPYELPDLPYDSGALAPTTTAETTELHHDGLHANYVAELNAALGDQPDLQGFTLEDLLLNLASVPTDEITALNGITRSRQALVQTNAGGHYNHSLWWDFQSPDGGGEPDGALAEAIDAAFGTLDTLKDTMRLAALGNTGSGWTWLVADTAGALTVITTPDQDNPIITGEGYPVFGIDNWEHSYLLDYTSASGRGEWINAFWDIVNWPFVTERYASFLGV